MMREIEPPFEIEYEGKSAMVTEAEIKEMRVFHILFSDKRKPLTITVGQDRKEVKFWTSIPQGRQTEAEQIGKLIGSHIRNKRK
jgi:hypothetical protein